MTKASVKTATEVKATNAPTDAQIKKSIKAVTLAAGSFGAAIDKSARLIFDRASADGNCAGALTLYLALGENCGPKIAKVRQSALVAWFKQYTPIRIVNNSEKGPRVGMIKKTAPNYTPFDEDGAMSVSVLDLVVPGPERVIKYSQESAESKMQKAISAILDAIDENRLKDGAETGGINTGRLTAIVAETIAARAAEKNPPH